MDRQLIEHAWLVKAFDDFKMEDYENDLELYPAEMREKVMARRRKALEVRANPDRWVDLCSRALIEIGDMVEGPATAEIEKWGVLDSLTDFVVHMFYFHGAKTIMEKALGRSINVLGNYGSTIHDVDKLDPIMLVGFTERWTDQIDTGLWRACIANHYKINVHHQENDSWDSPNQEFLFDRTLEMVCDKSSRTIQKTGADPIQMWDLTPRFYKGAPEYWMKKAAEIVDSVTEWVRGNEEEAKKIFLIE